MIEATHAIGIDIGGTGIKAAIVDLTSGQLVSERIKIATPHGGEPDAIVAATKEILHTVETGTTGLPVGICFPAIVKDGHTLSAANVSKHWIGLNAVQLFESELGRPIHLINDADAAGYAELHFGAAKDVSGLVILTTLGTGIGSALIYNGSVVPNTELGHLNVDGHDAESRAAYSAMDRESLSWKQWAARLQRYYETLEYLFSPDRFIVGGGVSKRSEHFLPLLKLRAPIVPAEHRNSAGILGAAALTSTVAE